MKENKGSLTDKFLLFFSLFPLIFQDLPLVNIFGTIAKCPAVFIAPIVTLILVIQSKKIEFYIVSKYFGLYALVTIVTALIMVAITLLFVTDGNLNVYSEFIPIKLIKASSYNITYFLTAYNLCILCRKVSLGVVKNILEIIWVFLTVYGIMQLFILHPIPFLHYTEFDEYQTRFVLTASEPSSSIIMYTIVFSVLIGLRFYLKKNKLLTALIVLFSFFILLGIGSKGGLFFIGIALLWVFRKNFNWRFALVILVLFVPLAYFFVQIILPQLLIDIDEFTSFSTRTTTSVVAFKSLFNFPIGQGYGTYLVYFPKMLLPTNKDLSSFLHIPLLDDEMVEMVNSGVNLGVKSGIPHEIMLNGFSAVFFFFFLFKYYFTCIVSILNPIVKTIFLFLGTFLLMDFIFAGSFESAFLYLLPFVLIPIIIGNELLLNKEQN